MLKRLWNKFIQKIAKDAKKELVKDLWLDRGKHDGEKFPLKYIDFKDFNAKNNND